MGERLPAMRREAAEQAVQAMKNLAYSAGESPETEYAIDWNTLEMK